MECRLGHLHTSHANLANYDLIDRVCGHEIGGQQLRITLKCKSSAITTIFTSTSLPNIDPLNNVQRIHFRLAPKQFPGRWRRIAIGRRQKNSKKPRSSASLHMIMLLKSLLAFTSSAGNSALPMPPQEPNGHGCQRQRDSNRPVDPKVL